MRTARYLFEWGLPLWTFTLHLIAYYGLWLYLHWPTDMRVQ